jgi:hypothetical protein
MTAGRQDAGYALKLQRLDWNDLFANRGMGAMIEAMRDEWKEEYDFVFIDSRTGFTDAGGVCTVQLPDVVVAVFTANAQSLDGACLAVERAQVGRQLLEYDRSSLIVLPLLSRFDGRAEVDDARAWVDRVARRVAPFYESWLSTGTPYRQVVERTKVPHVPKFSFGERLPVTVESVTDPDTMAFAYSLSAEILSAQFNEVERLILGTLPAYDLASSQRDLDEVYADLERRLEALPRSSTVLVAEAGAAGVAATVYGFYVATRSAALLAVGTAIGTAAVTFGWEAYRLSRERRAQVRRMGNRMREARVLHAHSPERQRTTLEALSQELASLEDGT